MTTRPLALALSVALLTGCGGVAVDSTDIADAPVEVPDAGPAADAAPPAPCVERDPGPDGPGVRCKGAR